MIDKKKKSLKKFGRKEEKIDIGNKEIIFKSLDEKKRKKKRWEKKEIIEKEVWKER